MKTHAVQEILENYREDLQDYRKWLILILNFKQEFEKDFEEKLLGDFTKCREKIINQLQLRDAKTKEWYEVVCEALDIQNFSIGNLIGKLSSDLVEQLQSKMTELQALMEKIQIADLNLISELKIEGESTKQNLQRLKTHKKVSNVYQNSFEREAQFIDKNK